MELSEVIKNRRSIRKFKATEIPAGTIREILELAQLAPSAGNMQAYRVHIIESADEKRKLMEATMSKQESIVGAPVVLVICADQEESGNKYGDRGKSFYSIQDATIFAAYVQLIISSLGLAAVWVGGFSGEAVKVALSLPPGLEPVAMLPFGHPDGEPRERERKRLEDIII